MAENVDSPVLLALLQELVAQGQANVPAEDPSRLRTYPVHGTIDLMALAKVVRIAVGGEASEEDDDAKTAAELNAANDG